MYLLLTTILAVLQFILLCLLCFWVYNKLTRGVCKCSRHLVGKVVIVTGGNAGIGYETAKDLAERGARVILACRSEARGVAARDQIIRATGNTDVHYRALDLASFKSVRQFADEIIKSEKQLDILINNAGVCGSELVKTEDELLLEMQINYFGPFLLTSLLLPLLKSSAPSRIINVSSVLHEQGKIDFNDLNMERVRGSTSNRLSAYCNSKLCNILTTVELDRQLSGSGVTVNSVNPGAVATDILQTMPFLKTLMSPMVKLFYKTPWEGAQTTIYMAVSPDVASTSGKYFSDCQDTKTSKTARDLNIARKLWDESVKITKLQ